MTRIFSNFEKCASCNKHLKNQQTQEPSFRSKIRSDNCPRTLYAPFCERLSEQIMSPDKYRNIFSCKMANNNKLRLLMLPLFFSWYHDIEFFLFDAKKLISNSCPIIRSPSCDHVRDMQKDTTGRHLCRVLCNIKQQGRRIRIPDILTGFKFSWRV